MRPVAPFFRPAHLIDFEGQVKRPSALLVADTKGLTPGDASSMTLSLTLPVPAHSLSVEGV